MSTHPAEAELTEAHVWSAAQEERLEAEWRRLRRAFAYHPSIEIVPLPGDPPAEYQVHYKVTTLVIDEAGQLVYVASCPIHLWLPPHFPHTAPVVRPMVTLFHPNATAEWVHLNPAWRPDASLVDVVTQVGFLLAFRSYDPNAVANPVAMNWVFANPHLLPTDAAANFSPAAGGEPLARVVRFGLATLRDLQERLESACERLVAAAPPPTRDEIDALLAEAGATLTLFLEADVPEHLRSTAAELQELAASLRERENVWTHIARQIATSHAVSSAANEVIKAEESLRRVLAAESTPPRHSPSQSRVPPAAIVQPAAMLLRKTVREAQDHVADLRKWLAQLADDPRVPPTPLQPGTVLARRLARELSRLAAASEPAREAGAWLASLEPVLQRASLESAAADRLAAWADHAELLRRGQELVERIRSTGPAELQSYRIETIAGKAGPFEFEQPVAIDSSSAGRPVAVWNVRASIVRVVDVETEDVVARGDARVPLPSSQGTIHVGDHTDELRVQLDYLLNQSRDALVRLRPDEDNEPAPADAQTTWAARLAAELDQPHEQQRVRDEHRRAADTWKQLFAELAALGRFKQRMATYHLAHRLLEFAKRVGDERARLGAVVSRANAQLAEIGARSGRDLDTDGLIIPLQYAAEYSQHMSERDRAQTQVRKMDAALEAGAERLRLRLAKPRSYGSAELPRMRLLSAPPESYAKQQPYLSDDALLHLVAQLEDFIGKSLRQPVAPPSETPAETAGGTT